MVDSNILTLERFNQLADAFGGDLDRWPDAEHLAAAALARAEPARTAAILAEAAVLDRLLAASTAPVVSPALRQAVVAAAPRAHGRHVIGRRWLGLGLSLAAASVAGIWVGAAAAPVAASHIRMQAAADPASDAARWLGEPADLSEG